MEPDIPPFEYAPARNRTGYDCLGSRHRLVDQASDAHGVGLPCSYKAFGLHQLLSTHLIEPGTACGRLYLSWNASSQPYFADVGHAPEEIESSSHSRPRLEVLAAALPFADSRCVARKNSKPQ